MSAMPRRGGGKATAAIERRIRAAIEELRPLLRIEPAGIELHSFDAITGTLVLRIEGDCPDCEMSAGILMPGIAAHLRLRVPEIRDIHQQSTPEF
jgi:Fe-S cluster biogenesis protein NfuA